MPLPQSKVTAQGQISVPTKIRRKLGLGPGSILEWEEEGDRITVRKAGRHSSEDIHRALFPTRPQRRSLEEMKEANRSRPLQSRRAIATNVLVRLLTQDDEDQVRAAKPPR